MNHKYVLLTLTVTLFILVSLLFTITYRIHGGSWIGGKTATETPLPTDTASGVVLSSGIRVFSNRNELLAFLNNIINYGVTSSQERSEQQILVPRGSTEEPGRYSQTNIQVKGVDEPDIVKTNGRIIVYAYGTNIYILDPLTDTLKSIIRLSLNHLVDGLFLYENLLIVLSSNYSWLPRIYIPKQPAQTYYSESTSISIYDISEPSNPVEKYRLIVSGRYFGSRMVGKYLYVLTIMDIYRPVIPLINGDEISVDKISLISLKPTNYLVITAVDAEVLTHNCSSFLIDRSSLLYVSNSRIYIGRPIWGSVWEPEILIELSRMINEEIYRKVLELVNQGRINDAYSTLTFMIEKLLLNSSFNGTERFLGNISLSDKTIFYVFKYKGLNISFSLVFQVNGIVLDQFAMEELNESFIVATTSRRFRPVFYKSASSEYGVVVIRGEVGEYSGEERKSILVWLEPENETMNNVYIIDISKGEETGRLENLAPGERIYSARLVKNILFLVTYRAIDPLFAIDVTNTSNPVVLGFLKIPGFSEYLHPVSDELLLGIGVGSRDETGQAEFGLVKFSLFNVTDPSKMSEISYVVVNGWSTALYDHHAVTIDPDYSRIYIPLTNYTTGGVIVLKITRGERVALEIERFLEHSGAVRTVYVDNKVYTISDYVIKVYEIESLKQINEIELPHP